jgi:hypothetical protein
MESASLLVRFAYKLNIYIVVGLPPIRLIIIPFEEETDYTSKRLVYQVLMVLNILSHYQRVRKIFIFVFRESVHRNTTMKITNKMHCID